MNSAANTRKRVNLVELNARLNEELKQYREGNGSEEGEEMREEREEVDEAEQ